MGPNFNFYKFQGIKDSMAVQARKASIANKLLDKVLELKYGELPGKLPSHIRSSRFHSMDKTDGITAS